jgi:hypothetical protein
VLGVPVLHVQRPGRDLIASSTAALVLTRRVSLFLSPSVVTPRSTSSSRIRMASIWLSPVTLHIPSMSTMSSTLSTRVLWNLFFLSSPLVVQPVRHIRQGCVHAFPHVVHSRCQLLGIVGGVVLLQYLPLLVADINTEVPCIR